MMLWSLLKFLLCIIIAYLIIMLIVAVPMAKTFVKLAENDTKSCTKNQIWIIENIKRFKKGLPRNLYAYYLSIIMFTVELVPGIFKEI